MMTVAKLHKLLGAMIEKGHGRKPVCIDKRTFRHPTEDEGTVILEIDNVAGPHWVPTADDDGGTKWNQDGSEAGRQTVVLRGDHTDDERKSSEIHR